MTDPDLTATLAAIDRSLRKQIADALTCAETSRSAAYAAAEYRAKIRLERVTLESDQEHRESRNVEMGNRAMLAANEKDPV